MKWIAALATDDGRTHPDRHFGDALRYDLYSILPDCVTFLQSIENRNREEADGDAKKAGNIGQRLKKEGVQVVISRQFGSNIQKIQKSFLPVISRCITLEESLQAVVLQHDRIKIDLNKSGPYSPVVIKPGTYGITS